MVLTLEGGCLVAGLKEGEPTRDGNLRVWQHFEGEKISLRVIEVNGEAVLRNDDRDEVLYVLERDTGIHLPAGVELPLEERMTLVGVGAGVPAGPAGEAPAATLVHLHEQPIQRTGDRWYRELIQGEMTQFVGSIPPGRAPDHFHLYEEVLCLLQGSGFLWSGKSKTPIGPGSCIYLPVRQPHCVENTTSGELRLLGVFYPAGSPSVRYEVHERAHGTPSESKLEGGD
jgi:mannose-6-phosphate isomerase-like protein (cupin superfamily)